MTFLHKLARRLSVIRVAGPAVLLLASCSPSEERDFLSPNPGQPSADLASITVSPKAGSAKPGETIRFSAQGATIAGKPVAVEATWEATGGTISPDGVFVSDQYGKFSVVARARTAPHISDVATVQVFITPKDILLVEVSPDSAVITEGEGLQLQAEVQLADGTRLKDPPLDWSSTGGYVDGSGWFSGATSEGTYTVKAKSSNGVDGNSKVFVRSGKRVLMGLDVTPASLALMAGQTAAFSVTGTWNDGSDRPPSVLWSATGGSVDGSGVFTAGSTAGNFMVIARDKFSTLADTARISIAEPVVTGLDISPGSSALAPGAALQYVATARMSDGTTRTVGASWQATGGTISAGGLYTASPTEGTYKVVGKIAGTSLVDTADVAVAQPAATVTQLILNPSSASVPAGATRQFAVSATWSDGSTQAPAVTWSATGGTITSGGLFTAGTSQGTYRVIATEAGGKADTSAVTVTPPALTDLVLNPSSATLFPGDSRQFTVSGSWTDGSSTAPGVTWTVAGGTMSGSGLFTAGAVAGTWRVIATQQGGTLADTSFVTVAEPAPVLTSLVASPGSVTLAPGGVQRFTVAATWSNGGTSLPPVTWSATGGTIGTDGSYTAGSQTGTFRVIAMGGGLADTSVVTISQAAPTLTSIVLSPASTSLQPGGSRQFYVSGTWSDGSTGVPSVTWSATGGTVTNGGLYVAGQTAGAFRVIATQAGGGVADTAEVTVSAPVTLVGLSVSPDSQIVQPGRGVQYSATGLYSNGGTGSPTVTWSATGGTITNGGLYVAGSTAGSYRVIAAQTGGGVADTAEVTITAPVTLVGLTVAPDSQAVETGRTVQFTVTGQYSNGGTGTPSVVWSATGGTVSSAGLYTAGQTAGTFRVVAASGAVADTAPVRVTSSATLTSFVLTPASLTLAPGASQQFQTAATWSDGVQRPFTVTYLATGGMISVSGLFSAGQAAGAFLVIATCSCGSADTTAVSIQSSTPPPPTSGDLVVFPSAAVGFIVGPQVRAGSASNPWSWFDENMVNKGLEHAQAFPASPVGVSDYDSYVNQNYYDLGLALYTAYYRTGDTRLRDGARKVADSWWLYYPKGGTEADLENNAPSPRTSSLGGLMLRALDGRPEMWPWIVDYVRYEYDIWLGRRLSYSSLYYGVRDGGYMLLYSAWLASAHPDAGVRNEFRAKALDAAKLYYARLQYPDGSWRWQDDSGVPGYFMQPFMVGLLLDGMVAVHRLTNDAAVGNAVVRSVENLYTTAYRKDGLVPELTGVKWRGMWYFIYGTGCETGCGATSLAGGWDTNTLREVRQLNPLTLHAFGYAYQLTGDPRFITWGDEVFASTFGNGRGPGADAYSGLADFRQKEYNASYRSSGRYLAWRLGQ